MPARFLAYLATAGAETLSAATLCAQARAMWPGLPMTDFKPLITITAPEEMGGGPGFILEAGTHRYTILFVAGPLPADAHATPVEITHAWPEARIALATHTAHVVVATSSTLATHAEALDAASATSLIIAALTTLLPAVAVIWSRGETIAPPGRFRDATMALQRGRIPVAEWVGIRWVHARPSIRGARQLMALTTGLEPFIGREIELAPSPLPPELLALRLTAVCQHIILTGDTGEDGERPAISHTERIHWQPRDQGARPGVPILELSVDPLDPARMEEEAPRGFGRKRPDQGS